MFAKGQMANMMKQAQQMQEKMQQMQIKINELEAQGEAAAGMVKVTVNGNKELVSINISDDALSDKEMLEDLIIAAFNNAHEKIQETIAEKTQEVTGGMGLPAGMKLPF